MESKEKALCLAAIALMRDRLDFLEKEVERLSSMGVQESFFIRTADLVTTALATLAGRT